MRLYYEEDGEKMYLNVSYWSFLKCYTLGYFGFLFIAIIVTTTLSVLLGLFI